MSARAMGRGIRCPWAGLLVVLVLVLGPSGAEAQTSRLAAECADAPVTLRAQCVEAMLGFQAAQGGAGLAASGGGSVFPGNASTLGRRFGTQPRTGWNLQLSGVRMSMPAVTESTDTPARGERFVVPALIAAAGVGLFDGFSPMPTVGGVLSVDGVLSANATFLPSGQGFQDNVFGYGIGVRVGLLRESFTLPGVSVSGMWRGSSTVRLGDPTVAPPADMAFDLSALSIRGTVGKDFLLFGLLAGMGYDRYSSDADIAVRGFGVGTVAATHRVAPRGFTTSRTVFFGGATLTYLVAQLSAEVGWSPGYDREPARIDGGLAPGAYDPTDGSPFLSLAARLTL